MDAATLENLPDEILVRIFIDADPEDIAHMCQVSVKFSHICEDNAIWRQKLANQFPTFTNFARINELFAAELLYADVYKYLYEKTRNLTGVEYDLILKTINEDDDILEFINLRIPSQGFIFLRKAGIKIDEFFNTSSETDANGMQLIITDDKKVRLLLFSNSMHMKFDLTKETEYETFAPGTNYKVYTIDTSNFLIVSAIRLAQLNRNGLSINFPDLYEINRYDSSGFENSAYLIMERAEREPKDIIREVNKFKGDAYLLQLLHAICVLQEELGAYISTSSILWQFTLAQNVYDGDTWQGEELNGADFWAYEIGDKTIYIRPCGFIIKILPGAIIYKGEYPYYLSTRSGPTSFGLMDVRKGIRYDVEELWRVLNIFFFGHLSPDSLWYHNKLYKSLKIETTEEEDGTDGVDGTGEVKYTKNIDLYILLRSEEFFGEYMHPSDLTPESKVIVLGRI